MHTPVPHSRTCRTMWLVALSYSWPLPLAYGQATSTFNGRVLDQGDAVLPGVTVTATNVSTGVARTTVTNEEGQYSIPGLEPGTYEIKTDLSGFAAAVTEQRQARRECDDHGRFPAGPCRRPGDADGHRTGAAHRNDAVEGREHDRDDRGPEPADDHAHDQRHAGTAARRDARRAAAPHQGERRDGLLRRIAGRQRGHERGRRRQPRQPLQRTAADVHDGKPGAVPAGVEPVHGGGRPHRRRGGHAGDEVRDERAPRIGLRLRARSKADGEGLLHEAGERRKGAIQPAAVWRIDRRPDHPEPDVLLRRDRAAAGGRRQVRPGKSVQRVRGPRPGDERRADAAGVMSIPITRASASSPAASWCTRPRPPRSSTTRTR